MKLIIDKEKITRIAVKILAKKLKVKNNKNTGLTDSDIEMFNRIFNNPVEEKVVYQFHYYLAKDWQTKQKKLKVK